MFLFSVSNVWELECLEFVDTVPLTVFWFIEVLVLVMEVFYFLFHSSTFSCRWFVYGQISCQFLKLLMCATELCLRKKGTINCVLLVFCISVVVQYTHSHLVCVAEMFSQIYLQ